MLRDRSEQNKVPTFVGLNSRENKQMYKYKYQLVDFPAGSVEESAFQCRTHGFSTWSGKIPHTTEQLRPCTTTVQTWSRAQELQLLRPAPYSPCSTTREATTVRSLGTTSREWPPLAATREKPTEQRRPSTTNK